MKLDLDHTVEVLKQCIQVCDSRYDLLAMIKFIDTTISVRKFPDLKPDKRAAALQYLIDLYHRRYALITEKEDSEEVDIKAHQLNPQ